MATYCLLWDSNKAYSLGGPAEQQYQKLRQRSLKKIIFCLARPRVREAPDKFSFDKGRVQPEETEKEARE